MNEEYNNSGIKPWQWVVSIAVVLILLGLGIYMMTVKSDTTAAPMDEHTGMDENSDMHALDRIIITDQFPGNIVYISTVELSHDGFVTIHKGVGGRPADMIGSQFFPAGNQPGSIDLSENTVDGATYYAVLRMDDGDGVLDIAKDLPALDENGAEIIKAFNATTDLPEDKG